jgi:hypothetical protein
MEIVNIVTDLVHYNQDKVRAVVGMWMFIGVLYLFLRVPNSQRHISNYAKTQKYMNVFFVLVAVAWLLLWRFLPHK